MTQSPTNITALSDSFPEPFELAAAAANIAEGKKAIDTRILDVGPVSSLSDYFVICSGESATQINAIAGEIIEQFKRRGIEPLGHQRDRSRDWQLIDFGDIVVHLFHSQTREFYQLERFWSHARTLPRQSWLIESHRQVS